MTFTIAALLLVGIVCALCAEFTAGSRFEKAVVFVGLGTAVAAIILMVLAWLGN